MNKYLAISILFLLTPLFLFSQINVDYWRNKGIEKFNNREYNAAIEYLNTIVRYPPENKSELAFAYYLRGISKYNLDDFRGALIDVNAAVENDTLNSEYYSIRGKVKDRLMDVFGALFDYNKAIELMPINVNAYINRCVHYLIQKEYDKALVDCNRIIEINETVDAGYYFRALAKQYSEHQEDALKDFNKAIKLNPKNPEYYTRRGLNRFQLKDTIGALSDYNAAIKLDSVNTYAYFNRALVYSEQAKYTKALQDYDFILTRDPENALTYYNRAGVKLQLGRLKEALEDYNQVLKINPTNFYTYFNRAIVWQRLDNYRRAIIDYTQAITYNPIFASAYYNRSLARRAIYDFKGAEEDYKAAVNINSNFEHILQSGLVDSSGLAKMAEFKADFGEESGEAIVSKEMSPFSNFAIQLMISISPDENAIPSPYAVINELNKGLFAEEYIISSKEVYNSAEKEKAIAAMLDTIEINRDNWAKLFQRAVLKYQLKNYNSSIEDYNMLVKLNPFLGIAFFNRANAKFELAMYLNNFDNVNAATIYIGTSKPMSNTKTKNSQDYSSIISDYSTSIKLDPGFYHAYFNLANTKILTNDYISAIWDFSKAIAIEPKFAEAYYNRGLTYIYINKPNEGCLDLSKAGELGIDRAYNVIKKFCNSN